jgi:hypothetical protein
MHSTADEPGSWRGRQDRIPTLVLRVRFPAGPLKKYARRFCRAYSPEQDSYKGIVAGPIAAGNFACNGEKEN